MGFSMIAEVTIELEARNLAANCLRSWRLDISRDLLGDWIADVRFGRIGSHGRVLRRVFASEPEAFAFMRKGLRRRATAPTRIGVAYRCARASAEVQEVLAEVGIYTGFR
jgi:hypothetical protein